MMIISIVCGLLMISGLFVVLCAVLSLMFGASLYEVGSMLVLAAILLAGSFCLQITLNKRKVSVEHRIRVCICKTVKFTHFIGIFFLPA